jgi:hypothetical protein
MRKTSHVQGIWLTGATGLEPAASGVTGPADGDDA